MGSPVSAFVFLFKQTYLLQTLYAKFLPSFFQKAEKLLLFFFLCTFLCVKKGTERRRKGQGFRFPRPLNPRPPNDKRDIPFETLKFHQ